VTPAGSPSLARRRPVYDGSVVVVVVVAILVARARGAQKGAGAPGRGLLQIHA
jgi:hypothetical protein